MAFRRPTPDELRLLRALATAAGMKNPDDWLGALQVREMDDGAMGSLQLLSQDSSGGKGRQLVECKAAVQFTDSDGVEVIASLNADEEGSLFELDMWKTDFSPLIRIPDVFRRLPDPER